MKKIFKEKLQNLKKNLRFDIIAGITVALVMIPQSMAYAGLAGLPMEAGLYTAFIWVIIWAVLGSSKQMSSWPVTIISIMTAATISSLWISNTNEYMIYAGILAVFIWITYLLLAILRLWVVVEFLSHPVILGFTNAIALITIFSQIEKILWIDAKNGDNYLETLYLLFEKSMEWIHTISFLLGIFWITLLLILKKFAPKIPRVLILIIFSTLLAYFLGFEKNFNWAVVWVIPSWLPNFVNFYEFRDILQLDLIYKLIPFAFIIWIIGFTESISVAKVVSIKTKEKVNSNRELVGQAVANMTSWFFGWYGLAGSFSRTAVNLRAEAKSSLSSLITGLLIWITLIFFTKFLYHIPMPTLAAIIIVAVAGLIKIKPIIEAWKIQKNDAIIAIITFIATIAFTPSVEYAIALWVFLSLAFYIYKSMKPKIVELGMYKTWVLRDADFFKLKKSKDISVFRVDESLFFANIWFFEKKILNFISEKKKLKIVVFDFEWMNNMDSSAFSALKDLINKLQKMGIKVIICWLRTKVIYKMDKVWFIENFWKENVFEKTTNVIEFLKDKYEKSEVNIKPLLEYSPINKKATKESEKIMEKINVWETEKN